MKKSYLVALLITAGAALWVASGMVGDKGQETAPAPDAAPAEHETLRVQVRDSAAQTVTAQVTVTGRTEAHRRVEIRSELAGQVEAIVLGRRKGVEYVSYVHSRPDGFSSLKMVNDEGSIELNGTQAQRKGGALQGYLLAGTVYE